MSVIKSISDYLLTCPYLNQNKLKVDEYSIDRVLCEPIIKQYIDGSSLRQYQFALTLIETNTGENNTGIKISEFYEFMEEWITRQNELNNFPKIEENVYAIEVIQDSSLVTKEADTSKYQVQLRILYRRD